MPVPTPSDRSGLSSQLQEEQRASWRKGERLLVEALIVKYPWLEQDAEALLDVVFNEVLCREELGDRPSLDEYQARFPHLSAQLAAHFAVHEALGPDPLTLKDTPAGQPQGPPFAALNLPGYEILGELGRGGMGVVYKARQEKLKRLVAVKMILDGALAGADEVARFRREAEAVARLQHPNIVQIHEIGDHDGRPFFTLEYVEGGSLAQRLAQGPLPAREAAALLQTLARAVHAAHQQQVIHRDLKPANILLADGRLAKVTDFGLARRLDDVRHTESGARVGTPQYMAPEQARGEGRRVGPAADIYALGAILFECLTGRSPFLGPDYLTVLEQVCYRDPVPPSRLQPQVPRDLETICLKCLRKEPAQRYASAQALADDLGRFLQGEPIRARATGNVERLVKWARRRPAVAAMLGVTLLTFAIALPLVTWKWLDADAARAKAVAALAAESAALAAESRAVGEVRQQRYLNLLGLADRDWAGFRLDRAAAALAEIPAEARTWDWHYQTRRLHDEWKSFRPDDKVNCLAFDPARDALATGGGNMFHPETKGLVRIRDAGLREVKTLAGHTGAVTGVAYLPDGRLLSASTFFDFLRLATGVIEPKGQVILWDPAAADPKVRVFDGYSSVAVSADGRRFAAPVADGRIRVWAVDSGAELLALPPRKGLVNSLAFDPKGARLVAAVTDSPMPGRMRAEVTVWDLETKAAVATVSRDAEEVPMVAFHPDGGLIAVAGSAAPFLTLVDAATGQIVRRFKGHTRTVASVAFSPDGRRLYSASNDSSVRVWDAATGEELAAYRGHARPATSLALSPRRFAGRAVLATVGDEETVNLWDLDTTPGPTRLAGHEVTPAHLQFNRAGLLASGSGDGTVRLWDVAAGRELRKLPGPAESLAFSPDGHWLAAAGGDATNPNRPGLLKLWDVRTGELVRDLSEHSLPVLAVAFSPDGRWLASASGNPIAKPVRKGEVFLWDLDKGGRPITLTSPAGLTMRLAFSPDGGRLALASFEPFVQVTELAADKEVMRLEGFSEQPTSLAFHPDGKALAVADYGGTIRVWPEGSAEQPRSWKAFSGTIMGLAYSPDGRRLASAGLDLERGESEVRLWEPERGQEVLTLPGGMTLAFSPDGRYLAAPGPGIAGGRVIQVWDAGPWEKPPQ